MNTNHRSTVLFSVVLIVACWTAPGLAQTEPAQPDRPFRGLFGGNQADPRSRQALNVNLSLFGSYEKNKIVPFDTDAEVTFDPRLSYTGFYTGGAASLDYRRNFRRGSFSAAGGTAFRWYRRLDDFTRLRDWGTAALSYAFGPKTSFNASLSAGYSPYFMNGYFPAMNPVLPGEPITPGYDNYTYRRPNYQYLTGVDFTRRLTQKASISAYYYLNYIDFVEKGSQYPAAKYYAQQIAGRFQYGITKNLAFRAGYGYVRYRHGLIFIPDLKTRGDNIDVGVDYQRTLRLGRRTTFGFTTGSAIVRFSSATYVNLLVHAYLNTAMGRSWNANLSYDRGFSFIEGMEAPYSTDAVAASIGGYLGRRVNVTAQAGYTYGSGVATSAGRTYGAWTGVAQLQVALARTIALFGQGYFYHFNFVGGFPYSPLPTKQWDRYGVRAGISFWLPLLR